MMMRGADWGPLPHLLESAAHRRKRVACVRAGARFSSVAEQSRAVHIRWCESPAHLLAASHA